MITDLRKSPYKVSRLIFDIVWGTKYRFKVLKGDIQKTLSRILIQIIDSEGIEILRGLVSLDYVGMHIECAPKHNISSILKSFKGRTSRNLQVEFTELKEHC